MNRQVLLSPSKCAAELAFRPAAQREEEVLAREREVLAVDVAAPLGAVPGQHGPAQLPRTAHHMVAQARQQLERRADGLVEASG